MAAGLQRRCMLVGIWFVYAGLLLGLCTTTYYVLAGYRKMQKAKRLEAKGRL